MKRLAICLSGQLRQWHLAKENQKWFWETAEAYGYEEIDYFIHSWTYSADRAGVTHEYEWRDIPQEEWDELCEFYQVKNKMFDTRPQSWFYDFDHWSALWYSFAHSIMMKKKYEMENNFQYDLVVKSRPDIIFNPKQVAYFEDVFDNQLYTTHGGEMDHEFGMFNLDDCVFYGNSYTLDMLVNMYLFRQKNLDCRFEPVVKGVLTKEKLCIQQLGPGVLMHEFCREYGITPHLTVRNRSYFQPTLLKLGCPEDLDLFKPKQFAKMEKYFREFYTK